MLHRTRESLPVPGGHPEVVGDERRYTDGGPRVTTGPTLGVITILTVPSGLSNVVAARGNMQQAPATAKGGGTTTSCMTTSEIAVSLEELANAIDADHPVPRAEVRKEMIKICRTVSVALRLMPSPAVRADTGVTEASTQAAKRGVAPGTKVKYGRRGRAQHLLWWRNHRRC